MGKKGKCRDCKECHRSGFGKLLRGYVRGAAALTTLGATEAVNAVGKGMSSVCPICGHRMGLHDDRYGAR